MTFFVYLATWIIINVNVVANMLRIIMKYFRLKFFVLKKLVTPRKIKGKFWLQLMLGGWTL